MWACVTTFTTLISRRTISWLTLIRPIAIPLQARLVATSFHPQHQYRISPQAPPAFRLTGLGMSLQLIPASELVVASSGPISRTLVHASARRPALQRRGSRVVASASTIPPHLLISIEIPSEPIHSARRLPKDRSLEHRFRLGLRVGKPMASLRSQVER